VDIKESLPPSGGEIVPHQREKSTFDAGEMNRARCLSSRAHYEDEASFHLNSHLPTLIISLSLSGRMTPECKKKLTTCGLGSHSCMHDMGLVADDNFFYPRRILLADSAH